MTTKLHPPQTAPRDGTLIFACFELNQKFPPEMFPAVWNGVGDSWALALVSDHLSRTFENVFADNEKLLGWLPMPTTTKEGVSHASS